MKTACLWEIKRQSHQHHEASAKTNNIINNNTHTHTKRSRDKNPQPDMASQDCQAYHPVFFVLKCLVSMESPDHRKWEESKWGNSTWLHEWQPTRKELLSFNYKTKGSEPWWYPPKKQKQTTTTTTTKNKNTTTTTNIILIRYSDNTVDPIIINHPDKNTFFWKFSF